MGKIFYGTHPDKNTAARIANQYAKNYKKCACYTPSDLKKCTFDANTNLWTCHTKAHHHEGSCGTWELHPRKGDDWIIGPIPAFPFPDFHSGPPFPPNIPPMAEYPIKPPGGGGGFNQKNISENIELESYEDATPEEYSESI